MKEGLPLSAEEGIRYSRHLVLPGMGRDGQRALKGSSVLVVGAGGLGIPALSYLAAAGVGRIGVADHDMVHQSNLQRQTVFGEADVGRNKAVVAAERLMTLNPHVEVTPCPQKLTSSNALKILEGYEIVVDATDNLPARYLINDACVIQGKPDVFAGAVSFGGQASVFWAERGPCYRCLQPVPPPPGTAGSCEESGILGPVPGVLGSILATQVVGLLVETGKPLIGRLLIFNGLDMTFDEIRLKKDPQCLVCGEGAKLKTLIDYDEFCGLPGASATFDIEPSELNATIRAGQAPFLLDVREPEEFEICNINGAKLIPLRDLQSRASELDPGADIVVYCHVGVRSTQAVGWLRRAGFAKARNLRGGIAAWSDEIDPSIPKY